MNNKRLILIYALLFVSVCGRVLAQTGGPFEIKQSVIASGGGNHAGGGLSIESTTGQAIAAGASSGARFAVASGFWTNTPLAPTAAPVSVSGRVTTANGRGIRNVTVFLTDMNGGAQHTRTGSFGYYRFDGIVPGESYVISVAARRFVFARPAVVVQVLKAVEDVDFIAN